jgi:hypothetical protein
VAGGTGDVAFRILEAAGRARMSPCSTSTATCSAWGATGRKSSFAGKIDFVEANAESLPYPDKTFDSYTIAFGIRNVPRIPVALARRIACSSAAGAFMCLEFAPVDTPVLDRIYDAYSFNVIPAIGRAVTGMPSPIAIWSNRSANSPGPRCSPSMIRAARASPGSIIAPTPAASSTSIRAGSSKPVISSAHPSRAPHPGRLCADARGVFGLADPAALSPSARLRSGCCACSKSARPAARVSPALSPGLGRPM